VSPALLDDIPCASIGVTRLEEIFVPLVEGLMKEDRGEFTECQKRRFEEVRRSKKYVNEIMGYDVLRGRAMDGEDDDEGEEGEM
jgi:hypothetical protein